MKKIIYFLLASLIMLACRSRNLGNENSMMIVRASVIKIDSTKYSYIYTIRNKNINSGMFIKQKECTDKSKLKRIIVGKEYKFFLQETLYANNFKIDREIINVDNEKKIIGDKTNIIFEDCLNVCGKYIIREK